MRVLLRYTNRTHIATALTEAGYPVSYATVNRWAKGQNVTPRAVALVESLLGSTKEPRPEWAEALEAKVSAIQEAVERLAELLAVMIAAGSSSSQPPVGDSQDAPGAVQPGRRRGR